MSFYKARTKVTSTFLNNYNTYSNALIQNVWFKTKSTESTDKQKTSFPKGVAENADQHKPTLNKIMAK